MSDSGDKISPQLDGKSIEAAGGEELDPLIGVTFDSRFEVVSLLGRGATGTVFKAKDILLQRNVALKVLHSFLLTSDLAVERFRAEAAICIGLSHNNLVRVYKQGVAADGRLYMVMDLLEGESLGARIAKNGKLDFDEFCDVFLQVIDALRYAHEKGIVHRDIKPSNIVLINDDEGPMRAVLVDLGIAKIIDGGAEQDRTKTNALVGSSSYMSPEQCIGAAVDARSDVYSLGCVMLEALVGKAPFQGVSALDVMYKHLNESLSQLEFLRDLPESVAKIIEKCLQKNQDLRYQNMDELKLDFLKCSDMRDTLKRRIEAKVKGSNHFGRTFAVATIVGVVLILIACYFLKQQFQINGAQNYLSKSKDHSELIPPEMVHPPLNNAILNTKLLEYEKKFGAEAAITILKRWEEAHAKHVMENSDDRIAVNQLFEKYYGIQGNEKETLAYANKVYAACDVGQKVFSALDCVVQMYLNKGQAEKALKYLQTTAAKYDNFSSYGELEAKLDLATGLCELKLGHNESAETYIRKGLKKFDDSYDMPRFSQNVWRDRLIIVLLQQGKKSAAELVGKDYIKVAQAAEKEYPGSTARAYCSMAEAFSIGNDLSSAEKYYDTGRMLFKKMGIQNECNQALFREVEICDQQRRYKRAIALLTDFVKEKNQWWEEVNAYRLLTEQEELLRNRKLSDEYARKGLQLIEKHYDETAGAALEKDDLYYLYALSNMYGMLLVEKKNDEAEKLINQWTEKLKRYGENNCLMAQVNDRHTSMLFMGGRLKEALFFANKSVEMWSNPNVQQSYRNWNGSPENSLIASYDLKAEVEYKLGLYQRAVETAKIGLLLTPTTFSPNRCGLFVNLADSLFELGKPDEAAKYYDEMFSYLNANSIFVDSFVAEKLGRFVDFKTRTGDLDGACSISSKIISGLIKRYGDKSLLLSRYYNAYANILILKKKPNDALTALNKTLALFSDETRDFSDDQCSAIVSIAQIYTLLGNYDLAESKLKDIVNGSSCSHPAEAYYQLAYLYAVQDKARLREETLEKGLQLSLKTGGEPANPFDLTRFEFDLAMIYSSEHRYAQSEPLFESALRDVEKAAGFGLNVRLSRQAQICSKYADCLLEQRKLESARKYFRLSADYFERSNLKSDLATRKETLEKWLSMCKSNKFPEIPEIEKRLRNLST